MVGRRLVRVEESEESEGLYVALKQLVKQRRVHLTLFVGIIWHPIYHDLGCTDL